MGFGHFGRVLIIVTVAAVVSGCATMPSGIHAVAPASQDQMIGLAPDTGEYTLYRAVGFADDRDPHVEPIWTVKVNQGQKLGFRWARGEDPYDGSGGLHLIAFAGTEARDMGSLVNRDTQYAWAGVHGDVAGYFRNRQISASLRPITP